MVKKSKKPSKKNISVSKVKSKHSKRTRQAKNADKGKVAKNTYKLSNPVGRSLWYDDPGNYDLWGVDAFKKKGGISSWSKPQKNTPKTKPPTPKKKQPKKQTKSVFQPGPFSSEQVRSFNQYSFYDIDINRDYQSNVSKKQQEIRKEFGGKVPKNVQDAFEYRNKALQNYYMESSRARSVAPPTSVVGPANYRGKPGRADNIRRKAFESIDKADDRLRREIKKANIEQQKEDTGINKAVQVGDVSTFYWTNSNRKFTAKAKITKVNLRTVTGVLTEDIGPYKKGQKISVPIGGTGHNRFVVEGKKAKQPAGLVSPTTEKENIKRGDKVFHYAYREGVVQKVNKKSYVVRFGNNDLRVGAGTIEKR